MVVGRGAQFQAIPPPDRVCSARYGRVARATWPGGGATGPAAHPGGMDPTGPRPPMLWSLWPVRRLVLPDELWGRLDAPAGCRSRP
jgi:hypothetical protein